MKTENKICRLCLNNTFDNFETIGDSIKDALNKLHLKIDLSKTTEPILCTKCSSSIQKWLEFESSINIQACSNTEGNIGDMTEDHRICRLCMKRVTLENVVSLSTEEKNVASVKILLLKCFSETAIDNIKDPTICSNCFNNLEACSTFKKNCLDSEKKVKKYCEDNEIDSTEHIELYRVLENENSIYLNEIKTEDIHSITLPSKYDDDSLIMDTILELEDKQFKIKDGNVSELRSEDKKVDINYEEAAGQSPQKDLISPQCSFKCDACDFHTKKPCTLKQHMFSHKNSSDITTYTCETCTFATKYKRSLKKHLLIHKNIDELTILRCHLCDYQTKSKSCLQKHMVTHNCGSEDTTLRCTECSYETKQKRYLFRHMLVHKSATEAIMHECTECSFKSKHKESLIRHMALHKSAEEAAIYICPHCDYQTKVKRYLRRHVKIHE